MEINLATYAIKFKYIASSFLLSQKAFVGIQRLVGGLKFSPAYLLQVCSLKVGFFFFLLDIFFLTYLNNMAFSNLYHCN